MKNNIRKFATGHKKRELSKSPKLNFIVFFE
ncbi:hypothetical protein GGR21_003132 [Dysgonomonas hofstadii]|uniref:Uncharacterized protein n=1 Tax=Dysgonomonas hofstadii TaxID=637886 RepID=A0A840CWR3_9BACT|nr:hypothetical protein [Dysgonomonas hofstadii]